MTADIDRKLLKEQAAIQNVLLDDEQIERFVMYAKMLIEWNEKVNLTAITEPEGIVYKHFADSLSIASSLPINNFSLIDVGTGAGFPGVPLAIIKNNMSLTLLDSLNKRLIFLKELCKAIDIPVKLHHSRAEDAAKKLEFRDKYDIATARAVASLPMLCELCIPFVKVGGSFIAMKGPEGCYETEQSKNAIEVLGAKLKRIDKINIKSSKEHIDRNIIFIDKIKTTPTKYPRMFAKIKKQPL